MQSRTEDLLTLRDGEPIDAALQSRLLASPEASVELRRLAQLRAELAALPQITPSVQTSARVLAAMRVMVGPGSKRRSLSSVFTCAAAVWAMAAGLVLWVALKTPESPPGMSLVTVAPAVVSDYLVLVEESARLERALRQLPAQRTVMTAGTAGTIAGLEDQISLIDEQLTRATAIGVQPEIRAALWRERVDVMNALVQVRYAQSKLFLF